LTTSNGEMDSARSRLKGVAIVGVPFSQGHNFPIAQKVIDGVDLTGQNRKDRGVLRDGPLRGSKLLSGQIQPPLTLRSCTRSRARD